MDVEYEEITSWESFAIEFPKYIPVIAAKVLAILTLAYGFGEESALLIVGGLLILTITATAFTLLLESYNQ